MVVAVTRIIGTIKTDYDSGYSNRVPLFLGSTQVLSWQWMLSSGLVPQDAVTGRSRRENGPTSAVFIISSVGFVRCWRRPRL